MAETLGLITNRRYTKDGFRPGSSSRISTHQGWPESGSLPRFLEVFLGSITRGRGHGRDVGSHHQPPLHQGQLQARELVADLDRAVVELLDVDRTAGLEQEAHAANRLRCSHGLRADGEKLQHPLFPSGPIPALI